MADDKKKKDLTEEELKKAKGGTDRTRLTNTGPSRPQPPQSGGGPGVILDPLGDHDQASPQQGPGQVDPSQQP